MYAVEVDTSDGFELCPADACAVGDAFCPVGEEPRAKFTIIDDIDPALKRRYEAFLAANDIDVAGIEFITDADGAVYTYDVNTNTNYNPDAEARAGRSGMDTSGPLPRRRTFFGAALLAMTGYSRCGKDLLRLHPDQRAPHGRCTPALPATSKPEFISIEKSCCSGFTNRYNVLQARLLCRIDWSRAA